MAARTVVIALLIATAARPAAAESQVAELANAASTESESNQPTHAGHRWWPLVEWLASVARSAPLDELGVYDRAADDVASDIASFLRDPAAVISAATSSWRHLLESFSAPTSRPRRLDDSDYTALLQPAESPFQQRCLSLEARLERCRAPWSTFQCSRPALSLSPELRRDFEPFDWTHQLCLRLDLAGSRS